MLLNCTVSGRSYVCFYIICTIIVILGKVNKMLTPTKHTKIKYSVIYISGIILKYVQNENIVKYEDLKEILISNLGVKAKSRLNVSLVFLYSIGRIKYLKDLDAIAIVNCNGIINENKVKRQAVPPKRNTRSNFSK